MANLIPLVLKYEDWPQVDRSAWDALFTVGKFFEESGACVEWSEGSRKKRRQGYGQWLSFLLRKHPEQLTMSPAERVTKGSVPAYVEECVARLAPKSVHGLISDLCVIIRAVAPDADWDWLNRASNRLRKKADSQSLPPPHDITASKALRHALDWIDIHDGNNRYSHMMQAIRFRQGLMIAFLVTRPVRRRTLLATDLNDHLKMQTDGMHLHYEAKDIKTKRPQDFPLPKVLIPHMQRYLEVHRPVLLQGKSHSALWINQYGDPITPDGFSREFPKVMKRVLGLELRPHAFRHVAATYIAETDPEHANIIRDVLGHTTLNMANKHYNRAKGISACDSYQEMIAGMRKEGGKWVG
ncbi:Phage integrase family protein [Shimia gijangensis]|uniref:Phage integrase family protein n=1 Tax=Shimia gijangensis TaxID=1470563 RepID=A0A1M6T0S5_9RHOB|nr:tyrosine-type recombinase/integrase [Shimia gijangensis]SHK50534.1 Phage integrase family protein [Shimia gijangensis]